MKTNSISAVLAAHARTIATTRRLLLRRAWFWTGLLAFAAIALGPPPAQAAATEGWVHRYSNVQSNLTDEAVKVVRDAAGNIIVTGTTAGEALTIKYSGADGSVLWQQRRLAFAKAVAVDGSGNVVVTGSSYDSGSWDYYTAKYAAADGALLWERGYNSPANGSDEASAVVVDGSGDVVVTGASGGDYYTAKYAAADGALLWENRYNGPANQNDQASAVAVDGSGNVVVTGNSNGADWDAYTVKYAAADGALLWEKRDKVGGTAVALDGSGNVVVTGDYYTAKYAAADGALLWEQYGDGSGTSVAVDGSGNVLVTGTSYGTSADFYTAKYAAADGSLLWEKRYDGPANSYDFPRALAVDGSGNVLVTGWTDAVRTLGIIGGDYYTAKYAAADGALLWEKRYTGSAPIDASAQTVAVDGGGNVVVTGVAYNTYPDGSLSDGDYYTAKYAAANGALLWEKRYNGPANGNDQPSAMAVDGSGNVVVTGFSSGESGDYDYYTAKYAAANGALLWEKRYGPAANSWDNPYAVAVDGSGNVVVTGQSINTNSNDHYYTAKYAAADGALLWEKRDKGGGTAVAVDGSGNVVVTGYSYGTNSNSDYYTAKYAAADGALLWEKRYNGPANRNDEATAVAVDGNGNVVVAGRSYSSSTSYDYHAAKYAAADGALLWEKRYKGPAKSYPRAVAVDGSGNVLVTGGSENGTNGDYYTAKYAAADGGLLWERPYNGPANSHDYAVAVAVDGDGSVVVTGNSTSGVDPNGNTISDCYTAKYAAADGALLWEKRFTAASVADSPHCLALGPDGMVAVTGSSNGGYATVVYRDVPAVSIDLISTGVRLHVTGLPGRRYSIERAPAVTGPWSTINTQTASASGLFECLDTNPPAPAAFYRTSQP